MTPLDPDPLYAEAIEQAAWDEGYERGIRDSIPPFIGLLLVSIVAALVGGMLGWSIAQFTAPRSAAIAIPAGVIDLVDEPTSSGNPSLPSGAPRAGILADARADAGRVVADHAAEVGAPLMPAADVHPVAGALATRTGIASWFDDGPGLYGAVRSWRWGDRPYTVHVCRADQPKRCVDVRIRDFCACGAGRVIDLSPRAFAKLAPLWAGLVRVTVTDGRSIALPATDR